MAAAPSPARKAAQQMDRSWIRGVTKFSKPHLDGVREFMQFVSRRFDENEQILCPCCKCLNHIHQHQRDVEKHLYIHGMDCTYDKWVYHGESLDAEINENVGHLDALNRRQACDTDKPMTPSAGLTLTRQQTHNSLSRPHPRPPTKLNTKMGPGQKLGTREQSPEEVTMCEYEKASALASTLNNSAGQSKSKGSPPEASGSLYEPGDAEDMEQGTVDKGSEKVPSNTLTRNVTVPSGGRVLKRVMALEEEDDPARMTRQRTSELSSTEQDHHERTTIPQEGSAEDATVAYNCSTQLEDQNQMCNEGQSNAMAHCRNKERIGKDLDRITRALGAKIPVHIAEGKKRPEVPLQAAKFASQGGIVLRQHIPILPHWKEYKKDQTHLANYTDKVVRQFAIDTTNKTATDACADMLKGGQRQMRYRLKKDYFDGVPENEVPTTSPVSCMTDEQWRALVEMWSSPKHKGKCAKNKQNRQKVQFQQRTGSRCYIAHCHAVKEAKYKDAPPTAIDLFKECHCSSKNGFTEPVEKATAIMEAIVAEPAPEGQAPKSPAEVFSQVLPTSKFLQNVGLETAAPKKSTRAAVAARIRELEAELDARKQVTADLRDKVENLMKQVDDSEAARIKQLEELERLTKTLEGTDALLDGLLNLSKV